MKINHISAPMTGTEKSGLDLGCTRTTWLKWRKWGGRVVIRRSSARQTNTVDSTRPAWGAHSPRSIFGYSIALWKEVSGYHLVSETNSPSKVKTNKRDLFIKYLYSLK